MGLAGCSPHGGGGAARCVAAPTFATQPLFQATTAWQGHPWRPCSGGCGASSVLGSLAAAAPPQGAECTWIAILSASSSPAPTAPTAAQLIRQRFTAAALSEATAAQLTEADYPDAPPPRGSSGGTGGGVCPLGFTGDDLRRLKPYPVKVPNVWETFLPANLAWICAKNAMLVGTLSLNGYLAEVVDAEDRALAQAHQLGADVEPEWPPPPPLTPLARRSGWMALRELCAVSLRKLYGVWAAGALPARSAWKLLKDWRTSLQRKAVFPEPLSRRVRSYASTILRATCLAYAAEITVCFAQNVFRAARDALRARRARKDAGVGALVAGAAARVALFTARDALRVAGVAVLAAGGTALVAASMSEQHVGRWAGYVHMGLELGAGFVLDPAISLLLLGGLSALEGEEGDSAAEEEPQL